MDSYLFIYTTCKNKDEAKLIGRTLVSERLVACVNILEGMESIYTWNQELVEDKEAILISKTISHNYYKVELRIKELHSYTNPCVVAFSIHDGSKNYLQWINESIGK